MGAAETGRAVEAAERAQGDWARRPAERATILRRLGDLMTENRDDLARLLTLEQGKPLAEVAPFGGVKESGIGREGSKYGVEDWVQTRYLSLGGIEE